ncbi:hypothetical protein B0O80DRAFT_437353 [Mortierella sp. GBAus27b]|nr:hypothetical protein B0O80DRAFT_437353 [Mortierella sp. GBAus27b]
MRQEPEVVKDLRKCHWQWRICISLAAIEEQCSGLQEQSLCRLNQTPKRKYRLRVFRFMHHPRLHLHFTLVLFALHCLSLHLTFPLSLVPRTLLPTVIHRPFQLLVLNLPSSQVVHPLCNALLEQDQDVEQDSLWTEQDPPMATVDSGNTIIQQSAAVQIIVSCGWNCRTEYLGPRMLMWVDQERSSIRRLCIRRYHRQSSQDPG